MLEINGKYATAKVMIDDVESETISQIINMCNFDLMEGANVVIMPDTHAGKGSVVGLTAKSQNRLCPNVIGVDISCSISTYQINAKDVDLAKLDSTIKSSVPSGFSVRNSMHKEMPNSLAKRIEQVAQDIDSPKNTQRFLLGVGSLGGGNHFIELNRSQNDDSLWLTIHCGSRNFGKLICEWHQGIAVKRRKEQLGKLRHQFTLDMRSMPDRREQTQEQFQAQTKALFLPDDLCYLDGDDAALYLDHMQAAVDYARYNHRCILHEIANGMGWDIRDSIFTNHNYVEQIDGGYMVRKGAVSAKSGERLIIPMNMRDGSYIGVGKGNADWNYSSPHGAGRVLSRSAAKRSLSLEDYENTMRGVYSSCVNQSTLDESPMAYKNMDAIVGAIGETVDIADRIVPIYNFKASE
ncbi:RNA-splicing ligase RtcB [Campylobacterota bacterium]|nr:RNA-splicing ligase RtcB [Campylobacterota bacterium]